MRILMAIYTIGIDTISRNIKENTELHGRFVLKNQQILFSTLQLPTDTY